MTRPVEPRDLGPLDNAPLKLALVQARTTPVLALERPDTVEWLVGELHGWELVERQSNMELAVRLGPAGVEQQHGRPESVWVLNSPSEQFRAVLSPSSIAVECDRYSHWSDFQQALVQVLAAVEAVAAPGRVTRLGMRYINEVTDPRLASEDPRAFLDLLAEELISVALALDRPLAGSLSELRVREPFGIFVARYGLVAPGRYLLDLDAYDEQGGPYEPARLMEQAESFHARIESFFAWALQEDYLASLAAENRDPQ